MLESIIRIIILVIILVIWNFLFINKLSLKEYIKDGLNGGFNGAVGFGAAGIPVLDPPYMVLMGIGAILSAILLMGLFYRFRREGLIGGLIGGITFVILYPILTKAIGFFIELII